MQGVAVMKYTSNVVQLDAFIGAKSFSNPEANGEKIVSQSTPLENWNAPENKGFQAP